MAWVKEYLLKGGCFWQIKIPQGCSWSWRKILNLRTLAREFILYKVENGENIFMWLGLWHPDGVLLDT
jgi:hypothetical protein